MKTIKESLEGTWLKRGFTQITEHQGRMTDDADKSLVFSSVPEGKEIWINAVKMEVWIVNVPEVNCNNDTFDL